jgi:hypothetical protein
MGEGQAGHGRRADWAREKGRLGRSGLDRGLWKLLNLLADLLSSKAANLSNPPNVAIMRIPAATADAPADSSLGAKG